MRRWFLGLAAVLLLAALIWTLYPATTGAAAVRCTLTGQTVDKCCCVGRDGKLYCPLAKQTIETCCCGPVGGKAKR